MKQCFELAASLKKSKNYEIKIQINYNHSNNYFTQNNGINYQDYKELHYEMKDIVFVTKYIDINI